MEAKVYTLEEIKKLAPGYRGKPENFNPDKVGKKASQKPKEKQAKQTPTPRAGPSSGELPPPTHLQTKATPQRNESIIAESIFGVDISVTAIAPRQSFTANYSKVVDVAQEVYGNYRADEKQLDRVITKEEVSYYATAMLWCKLLDVKAKDGDLNLTTEEKAIRKAVADIQFNIPQPLFAYLSQIGNYTDGMGKETRLEIPPLPTVVIQNFGGYHANEINTDTHNLFEEIPSLGIAGDMVMALASDQPEPNPNFRVRKPAGTEFTTNLAGKIFPIGTRRPEIAQRLAGFGITNTAFHEFVRGTRFNLKYLQSISDIIGQFDTYKIEKVQFRNLSLSGGETQVIKSKPSENDDTEQWRERNVQNVSASTSSTATMGAAYCFGFQLFKEDGAGNNRREHTQNWSCVTGRAWDMPDDWYNNRNVRRDMPDGIGTERFRSISMRQDYQLNQCVRRMIKSHR